MTRIYVPLYFCIIASLCARLIAGADAQRLVIFERDDVEDQRFQRRMVARSSNSVQPVHS